jgi:integrase
MNQSTNEGRSLEMTFRKALDAASAVITSNQQSGSTSTARTREYLTANEVRTMMVAARKSGRYKHRDATMLLIGSRHGLDAWELCNLQWLLAGRDYPGLSSMGGGSGGGNRRAAARLTRFGTRGFKSLG